MVKPRCNIPLQKWSRYSPDEKAWYEDRFSVCLCSDNWELTQDEFQKDKDEDRETAGGPGA